MKNLKTKVAGLVLAVGVTGGLMAAPAFGAAEPNANGANCHGATISTGNAITGGSIAQFAKELGLSVKEVQGIIREYCAGP